LDDGTIRARTKGINRNQRAYGAKHGQAPASLRAKTSYIWGDKGRKTRAGKSITRQGIELLS
jgi:hypothetical protein